MFKYSHKNHERVAMVSIKSAVCFKLCAQKHVGKHAPDKHERVVGSRPMGMPVRMLDLYDRLLRVKQDVRHIRILRLRTLLAPNRSPLLPSIR